MEGLTPGRIVHTVLENADHRAATINEVVNADTGVVGLTTFLAVGDVENGYVSSVLDKPAPLLLIPESEHSDAHEPYTWHWIERS